MDLRHYNCPMTLTIHKIRSQAFRKPNSKTKQTSEHCIRTHVRIPELTTISSLIAELLFKIFRTSLNTSGVWSWIENKVHGFNLILGTVADPGGANPAMDPPIEVGNGVWSPLGGRKSDDSIVNMSKSKDFGPPVLMSVTDFAPLRKIPH